MAIRLFLLILVIEIVQLVALPALRVEIFWNAAHDSFSFSSLSIENSGTLVLQHRAIHKPSLGSFIGLVRDPKTQKALYYDSIGTGYFYKTINNVLTFRYPAFKETLEFVLIAENQESGEMESVLTTSLNPRTATPIPKLDISIKTIQKASKDPSIKFVIYAEGYLNGTEDDFIKSAQSIWKALDSSIYNQVGWSEHMEVTTVFSPSNMKLGDPKNLGFPIPEWDSFLGLYYPYWINESRWYATIYPTREAKTRNSFAQVEYDYPFVLVDSDKNWGIGNYNVFTAVPASSSYSNTLALHEHGHYFGLNEEYSSGGTELKFAPNIQQPWSQNIGFYYNQSETGIEWMDLVEPNTPIPTPSTYCGTRYGGYKGGYGGDDSRSIVPGCDCIMKSLSSEGFCKVCLGAMKDKIGSDS